MKLFQLAGQRVARVACLSLCAVPLLFSCGGKAELSGSQNDGEGSHSAAGSASASGAADANGGASAVGGASAGTGDSDPGTFVGGSANAGAPSGNAGAPSSEAGAPAGDAGAPSTEPPVSSFAGRWALIMSEELSGVELLQTQSTLTGTGCGGGAPSMAPLADPLLCGPVSGSARGNQAKFAYRFEYGDYTMTTTISADGTRMTGRMTDAGTPLSPGPNPYDAYPTAWVKLSDDEDWLPSTPDGNQADRQKYSLQLTSADAGATEYRTGAPYTLIYIPYFPHGGITGDLGTFSYLELSGASATDTVGTVQAGPVSITEPQLAVSLTLQKQDGQFTQVSASTGSGHHYTFTPTLLEHYP